MSTDTTSVKEPSFGGRVRNFILGTTSPDPMTMVVFILNLFFGAVNLFWSVLTYLIIEKKSIIIDVKSIQIDEIINKRGLELGFIDGDFLHRLSTLHAFGIVIWTTFLFGVILLFRQNRNFVIFNVGALSFYVGMLIFYMSYSFFSQDITLFDKIGFIIILSTSALHYFLLRKEQMGGSMNFFHEEESIE